MGLAQVCPCQSPLAKQAQLRHSQRHVGGMATRDNEPAHLKTIETKEWMCTVQAEVKNVELYATSSLLASHSQGHSGTLTEERCLFDSWLASCHNV